MDPTSDCWLLDIGRWSLNTEGQAPFIGDLDAEVDGLLSVPDPDIWSQRVDSLPAPWGAGNHVGFTKEPEIMAYQPDALACFLGQLSDGPWAQGEKSDDFHSDRSAQERQDSREASFCFNSPPACSVRIRVHSFLPALQLVRGPTA